MSEPVRIALHPERWRSERDFYDEILPQLGAPKWHGRNLDALGDSLVAGQINGVEPPMHIEIAVVGDLPAFADTLIDAMKSIAEEARSNGREIVIAIR